MSAKPQISIIIPSWNNLEFLKLTVASIVLHTELRFQLVIHVNDGRDGTLKWVQDHNLEYTWTKDNVGICHGLNLAAEKCTSDYVAYLNDDMYALPAWDRPLYEFLLEAGNSEPCYVAGTMIQAAPISPAALPLDYGSDPNTFQEARLLADYKKGRFTFKDWNGATWPPCLIHRKWWDVVDGYSVEFSPGFYSDIDFSMKLWTIGCRTFCGIGNSLVYHFGETTTSLVRGPRSRNVKQARIQFLKKWGVLPSAFARYYLRAGEEHASPLSDPDLSEAKWERIRTGALSAIYSLWPDGSEEPYEA